jgi:NAD(P)H-dependent flavin oxidoreductase YrpB (nitropropane dioxygenase family)
MNWVCGAELVAAVSAAGGLGTLGPNAGASTIEADIEITAERLRSQIRKVRTLTKQPFAVNLNIGPEGRRQYSARNLEIVIEEQVPVVVSSVGPPTIYTDRLKAAGIKVLHAISTPTHAKKAEDVGVDAVICEGFEAGGHKGTTELTSFVLIPMVADAVQIPVIAGGGIADARGVIAAMVLGADGIYMGTRFMATRESSSHSNVKEAVAQSGEVSTVTIDKGVMLGRVLRNQFAEDFVNLKAKGGSAEQLEMLTRRGQYQAQVLGDAKSAEICCGQVAALIDSVPSAGEVIQNIMAEIPSYLAKLEQSLGFCLGAGVSPVG